MKKSILYFSVLMASTLLFAQENYKTTWLGNTFGYGDKKSWVQNNASTMYVAPDGSCFTQSIWDEGHNENSVYKDGKKLGHLNAGGGLSVGGNGDTIFVHSGGGVAGRDSKTFESIGFSIVPPSGNNGPAKIYSIAARDGYLVISDPNNDRILVYQTNDKKLLKEFTVERPADIAIDTNNKLWIVQSPVSYGGDIPFDAEPVADPKILCYDIDGTKLSAEITGIEYPTAIAIDYKGRLLVCDDGVNQQIYCYKDLSTNPTLDPEFFNNGTFGEQFGIYQPDVAEKGVIEPDHFYHLAGVGTDAEGNLYVSLGGPAPKADNPLMDTDIRAFDKTTGELKWQLLGKEFVDMGDLDPDDKTKWYTKDSKYSLDWSKQEAGTEWSYTARTIDPFTYPHDARGKITGNPSVRTSTENIFMRRVGNNRHLLMYGSGMAGDQYPIRIFRFNNSTDGEFAIPAFYLSKQYGSDTELDKWPFNRPSNIKEGDEYMWLDKDGDGQMDAGEYEINSTDEYPYHGGAYVDAEGGIWTCYRERGIRRLTCQGFDENGVPKYSFSQREFYPCPTECTDVHFVRYLGGEDDIMYVAGWTKKHPNETGGDQPSQVRTIVKYKNWKTNPTVIWESQPAHYDMLDKGASFEVEGDYVFVGYAGADGNQSVVNGTVWIFSAETGAYLCELTPGPEVGNACGWMDIWDSSIRAHKIGDEYMIFVEEDWHCKTIVYRWTPKESYGQVFPDAMSIAPATVELYEQAEKDLLVTFEPINTNEFGLTWTSSDPLTVSVTQEGKIKALKGGAATITATSVNGVKAVCEVKVLGLDDTYAYKAADPFELYEVNSDLNDQGFGIGWSNKWKQEAGKMIVKDQELLSKEDGAHLASEEKGLALYYRDLSMDYYCDKEQEYWLSFDMKGAEDVTEASFAGFSLWYIERGKMETNPTGGNEILTFGYGWQETVFGISNVDDYNGEDGTTELNYLPGSTLTTAVRYTVKIKAQNGEAPIVYVWFNYDGEAEPNIADADIVRRWSKGLEQPFNRVRLGHGDTFSAAYDNVRIGLSWEDLSYEYEDPSGVEDLTLQGIQVYPTVVDAYFDIKLNDNFMGNSPVAVEIIDLSSRVLKTFNVADSKIFRVQTSDLSSGIYLVVIKSNDQVYTEKIVKK